MTHRRRTLGCARPVGLAAGCLLALACSSGGSGGSGTAGTSGAAGSGQAGASAGSSGGAQATAGSGGGGGGSGAGVAGAAGGSGGNTTGSAGTTGAAGQSGAGGAAGGRGGGGGTAGTSGTAGRGGATGTGGSTGGSGGTGGRGGTGGGTGGTSPDGGTASPVTPTMSGSRYRLAWSDVIFETDASVGARVSTLSLSGTDVIVPSAMAAKADGGGLDPTTWGSVFWTSPRSAWTPQTWPPPVNIDSATYTGGISGTHIVLNGPTDTSIGVSMSKDYSADATSGWITLAYTIKATKAQKAAPWEVSRVPRGGIVLFPLGTGTVTNQVPLTITQSSGIVWFDDGPKTATSPNGDKLYADGMGWTAYVLGGNLFLKKFTDQPASAQAPMEGEVDVYPGNGFLEFEVEGPYTMIAANGTLPWSIQWKVVKVPASVTIGVNSSSLVSFVQQQLAN